MSPTHVRCRVLVVEDDPLSRNALSLLLRHLGCAVTTARTAGEAVEHASGQTHVITDLLLADGSGGVDLLTRLRDAGYRPHTAVVTALELDDPVVRAAARLKPQIILRKPLDVDALLEWLERSRR